MGSRNLRALPAGAAADWGIVPEFLKLATAAVYIDTSVDTVRDWIRKGQLTAYRNGKNSNAHLYVRREDLLNLFDPVTTVGSF